MKPIFSNEDSDLANKSWRFDRDGYARTTINLGPQGPITKHAHRIVVERKFGKGPDWSKREVVDHINGNKLDNRRENLRIVSIRENTVAGLRMRSDKIKNCTFHKQCKKWQAQVTRYGKTIYLGLFESESKALQASASYIKKEGVYL